MTTGAQDVIVVGAGIAGCLTAYLLAKQGLKATILEADSVGSHASGFAFGGLSPLDGSGIPNPLLGFSVWCFQRHATLYPEFQEAAGIDTQFHLRDRLNLAFEPEEVSACREDLEWQQKVPGFKLEWLEPAQALKVEPRTNPECLGAVFYEGTGAIEAYRYNLAAAQAGEKLGVAMLQRRVTGLLSRGDLCTGVTFASGQLEAGAVVLALGPWTGQTSSWCRFNLPIAPLKGQIIRLQLATDPMRASLNYRGSYAASKPDGLIWAGTTEEDAGFDEELTSWGRDKVMGDLLKMAPSLSDAELVQQTACLRPLASDGIPVVGKVPGWENLYVITGGGRKGILWSTGMAQGLAELMLQGRSQVPGLEHLDPARFPQD
ncbi:MAG: NAD(P)/FAD-dependent oxidoreductase [Dehalococcoidia bacterium]